MSVLTPKNTPSCFSSSITLTLQSAKLKKRAWTITNYTVLLHGAALAYLELLTARYTVLVKGSFIVLSVGLSGLAIASIEQTVCSNIQNRDRTGQFKEALRRSVSIRLARISW